MMEKEEYFWDLNGHLVVRDVLEKDEIAEVNEALDFVQRGIHEGAGELGGATSLSGTPARWYRGDNLLSLPRPHCEPFRKMLAHAKIVQRLVRMCGKGVRLDHGPQFNNAVKGTRGLALHGAGHPHRPYVGYHHQNGSGFCNGVTVTWNLTDCPAGGGGFACVPGSHKSRYPVPDGVRNCDADMGTVIQPEVNAGDVLFFMDGAQTHGTHPWQNDHERRSVLFKYAGRTAIRQDHGFAPPESYWEPEIIGEMTAEQLAVMWGPFSGSSSRLPVLVCDEDGTVHIEGDTA